MSVSKALTNAAWSLDDLLKHRGRFAGIDADGSAQLPRLPLLLIVLLCGPSHGFAMGLFSLNPEQALYSAIKIPLLLIASAALCMPSFFVFHALLGVRDDFGCACRAMLKAQAVLAISLLSLTPALLLVYASTSDYPIAVFANGILFAIATAASQCALNRDYAVLVARNPNHRTVRRAWTITFVFIAIQLAWVLRPFIGYPGVDPQFLRDGAWSNAYVVLAEVVVRVFGR